ncbi:CheR family methyltransferase [Saccharophagus degradans]|uniref:protein-glutamate O-methyltransferase n=1 Tax=Saccharophagus degradans (strain 2-40 / ATCC 43961 / DSM 17024) TaxID=203122 RepID=Q21IK5_SACD2|nr:protein-glutamate O-methyltransferase CheR [Saccharophagus degradans]ABD81474.1 MCP methyltransferase, CheR-type [Saccharophagus degradans 2-40]
MVTSVSGMESGAALDAEAFEAFRIFLQEAAGIDLGSNKQYLVATRIRRILIDYKLDSLIELVLTIKQPSQRELRQKVIDAMTTNETFWFRDIYPYDYLQSTLLPEWFKNKPNGRMRIWSSACSSGQEPYSISIVLEEFSKRNFGKRINAEIVATDLSTEIMAQAKSAEYDRLSVSRGLSSERLRENFEEIEKEKWRVKPSIKSRITFRPQNLKDSYVMLGKFDIVFCRNVLIYFSSELKQDIIKRIHATMVPGGYLFLGSSESLGESAKLFDMVHCSPGVVYRAK